MLKLILVLVSAALGGMGVGAYLLSEPDSNGGATARPNFGVLPERLALARTRFEEALTVGRAQGDETERRMQQQLSAYQKNRVDGARQA